MKSRAARMVRGSRRRAPAAARCRANIGDEPAVDGLRRLDGHVVHALAPEIHVAQAAAKAGVGLHLHASSA
jgi:hypothetical protein